MIRCDGLKRILIVGEVFVDRHIRPPAIRLGGLFHIARAFDALQSCYAAAWIGPAYLDGDCDHYFRVLNAQGNRKIGDITGSPNIVEISDPTEAGDQRYTDLLADRRHVRADAGALRSLIDEFRPTDILLILDSSTAWVAEVLTARGLRLTVDADHWPEARLPLLSAPTTVFSSTSGLPFQREGRIPTALRDHWRHLGISDVILKENRGGSRIWSADATDPIHAPCFPTVTAHSVGVGECFDAAWVAASEEEEPGLRLRAASWVASLYAATLDHATFVDEVRTSLKLDIGFARLEGAQLPWERRPMKHIYLAAPDFPTVDTRPLNELEAALRYHNFAPHRPILENGLADSSMSATHRRALYTKDVALLEHCDVMIAVPLIADPGTFVELGWFAHSGKPTILYDPHHMAKNLFAAGSAARLCDSLTAVIDAVFEILGRPSQ